MERVNSQVIPAEPLESWIEESEASRVLLAGKKSKHSGKIRGISSSQPGVINVMRRWENTNQITFSALSS